MCLLPSVRCAYDVSRLPAPLEPAFSLANPQRGAPAPTFLSRKNSARRAGRFVLSSAARNPKMQHELFKGVHCLPLEWYRNAPQGFWDLVEIGAPDECWPWKRSLNSAGYGNYRENGEPTLSHLVAFRSAHGENASRQAVRPLLQQWRLQQSLPPGSGHTA